MISTSAAMKTHVKQLRGLYPALLDQLLEELNPRIEAGEFGAMVPGHQEVKIGSDEENWLGEGAAQGTIGVHDGWTEVCSEAALAVAIGRMKLLRDEDVSRAIFAASEAPGVILDLGAADVLAYDMVRRFTAAKRRVAAVLESPNFKVG